MPELPKAQEVVQKTETVVVPEPEVKPVGPTTMYLTVDSYVYKEQNESKEKTWLLKKDQEFVVSPASDDWVAVRTKDGKKGYVKASVLTSVKPNSK